MKWRSVRRKASVALMLETTLDSGPQTTPWTKVPLEKLTTELQSGFACQPSIEGEAVPQLRTNNVSPEGNIDLSQVKCVPAAKDQTEKYRLQRGDILFNNTNSPALVGKAAYFEEEGIYLFSNHMTRVRVDAQIADPRFVARYLHWSWAQGLLRGLVTQWVNQAAINRAQLASVLVPLPSLSEQHRIVEILDQADQLRRLRAEANAKADRILPAMFIKMFGDPVANPMGWPVYPLKALGQLDRGRSRHRPRNDPKLLGGPYPFIQTGDVAGARGIIKHYTATYSEMGLAQSRLWPAGTLCITIAANIAACAILGFDACFPDSVVGFTPSEKTNTAFIGVLLAFKRASLEAFAPQMAQKNINLETLRELPLPVPPKAQQDTFARHHDQILRISGRIEESREGLQRTWENLLHDAFTGKLTASWRKAHRSELLREMERQANALVVPTFAEEPD